MSLSSSFIDRFALKISRLSRAIRTLQTLIEQLPRDFPNPVDIVASRKPFDLLLVWEPSSKSRHAQLQARITKYLGLAPGSWKPESNATVYRGRVKLRGKDSLNLALQIKKPKLAEWPFK